MNRTIKFRAYIPEFEMMLDDVTVYDGDIGVNSNQFEKKLKEKHEDCHIDWDSDWGGGGCSVIQDNEDKDIYETRLSFRAGDEWMIIDEKDCVILQCTVMEDSNENEIYEGDIVELVREGPYSIRGEIPTLVKTNLCTIHFSQQQFVYNMYEKNDIISGGVYLPLLKTLAKKCTYNVIGNIYQDRHLLDK